MEFLDVLIWVAPPFLIIIASITGLSARASGSDWVAIAIFAWISVAAAVRFQLGDDWRGYEIYYDAIDINIDIVEGYFSSQLMTQFEPGYYVLAYITKSAGLPYQAIDALSVLMFFLVVVRIKQKESIPIIMILFIFSGAPYISLYYNQVRQLIAISFLFLALQSKINRNIIILFITAMFFHFSSVIFVIIILLSKINEKYFQIVFRIFIGLLPLSFALFYFGGVTGYDLIGQVAPDNLQFKVEIYQNEETAVGLLRIIMILFVIVMALFINQKMLKIKDTTITQNIIIKASILAALFVPHSVMFFPNSYAFFGRILVFSFLLFAFTGAIFHKQLIKGSISQNSIIPFYALGFLSTAYYVIALSTYPDDFLPYRTIFG